jgi:GxxExxY protein
VEVYDEDGTPIGNFVADLLIEDELLVELKACFTLVPEHTAQILGYLRGCRLRHGLLINFGAPKLQIKKLIL